jgi:hypothetical protein
MNNLVIGIISGLVGVFCGLSFYCGFTLGYRSGERDTKSIFATERRNYYMQHLEDRKIMNAMGLLVPVRNKASD